MFYLSYYIIIFQKIIGVAASYTHTYVRSCWIEISQYKK